MAAREFLYVVQESAFGTPVVSPGLGTNAIYCRLSGGNHFTMVGNPEFYEIPHGGGVAINAVTGSDQFGCGGQLTTELYGSQAVFMSNWFGQLINAGQTTPWVTTEPPGDLASCSVYHAVQRSDGSYKRVRFAGVKVTSWKIDCSRTSKIASLQLGLVGQKPVGNSYDSSSDPDATIFPPPAETAYPTDPFRFIDLAGNVTVGSGRTQFEDVGLSCTNAIDSRWFEGRFLSLSRFLGRKFVVDSTLLYKPTPDDLADFQNVAVKAASVAFSNGTHSLTVNMNAQNFLRQLTKELPLDKVYALKVGLHNNYDPSAATDLTITAT